MKINLDEINYYFLSCDETRKKHFIEEFNKYTIKEVNPIKNTNISKFQSGAIGMSKILDLVCQTHDSSKVFQPFVIFEDDVKKYRPFPKYIEIPNNSDIFYIGISKSGLIKSNQKSNVIFSIYNNDIVKIYNMLSTHGMIICSLRGLLSLQKCLLEDYGKNQGYDISLSQIQPYINAYAFKIPLVYQYKKIGGKEKSTKITFTNNKIKKLKKKYINKTNFSIITNYQL